MRTTELIRALAADAPVRQRPLGPVVAGALAAGALPSAAAFLLVAGLRPDFRLAMETARVLLKFAVLLSLAAPAIALSIRLARPGAAAGAWAWALAPAPLLLAAGVAAELAAVPPGLWAVRLLGANSTPCLTVIPLLAAAPLLTMLVGLRHGAATRPGAAGLMAGLGSGALAAALYATNCRDDSPLFLATWYPIAIGLVAAAGGLLGRRLLRW